MGFGVIVALCRPRGLNLLLVPTEELADLLISFLISYPNVGRGGWGVRGWGAVSRESCQQLDIKSRFRL